MEFGSGFVLGADLSETEVPFVTHLSSDLFVDLGELSGADLGLLATLLGLLCLLGLLLGWLLALLVSAALA